MDERPVGDGCRVLEQVRIVDAAQHRAGEGPVREGVDPPHRLRRAIPDSAQHVEVERHRVLRRAGRGRPQRLDGPAVREVQVMHRGERGSRLVPARRVAALPVAEVRRAPRLVEGRPGVHPVAERRADDAGVLLERIDGRAHGPSALVLERLRQVPVVQRRDGLDPAREQSVHQTRVEVEARLVGGSPAGRLDPRPRDREAIRVQAERGHQIEVALPPVVVVARDVTGVAVPDESGGLAEGVPDRRTAPVLVEAALDLVRRGRRPEGEGRREHQSRVPVVGAPCSQFAHGRHPVTAARSTSNVSDRPSGFVTVTVVEPEPPAKTRSVSPSR